MMFALWLFVLRWPVAGPDDGPGGVQKSKSAKNDRNHPGLPSISMIIINLLLAGPGPVPTKPHICSISSTQNRGTNERVAALFLNVLHCRYLELEPAKFFVAVSASLRANRAWAPSRPKNAA